MSTCHISTLLKDWPCGAAGEDSPILLLRDGKSPHGGHPAPLLVPVTGVQQLQARGAPLPNILQHPLHPAQHGKTLEHFELWALILAGSYQFSTNICIMISLLLNLPTLQVSMLSKGFGDVGDPKGGSTGTTGSQFLEQYKTAQALAQLAAQHSQTGPPNTNPSSWDTSATSLGQYGEMTSCCNYSEIYQVIKCTEIKKKKKKLC